MILIFVVMIFWFLMEAIIFGLATVAIGRRLFKSDSRREYLIMFSLMLLSDLTWSFLTNAAKIRITTSHEALISLVETSDLTETLTSATDFPMIILLAVISIFGVHFARRVLVKNNKQVS